MALSILAGAEGTAAPGRALRTSEATLQHGGRMGIVLTGADIDAVVLAKVLSRGLGL